MSRRHPSNVALRTPPKYVTCSLGSRTEDQGLKMQSERAPRVSLGMPVYNGEPFIVEALDSLLAQTFEDFEIVICDNASTDGTEEICRMYAEKDERIRYFRNRTNYGYINNFNLTFRLS